MPCRPEMNGADWAPWLARQERALSSRATVFVADAQVPAAPEEMRECDFLSMAARRLAQVGSAAAKRSLPRRALRGQSVLRTGPDGRGDTE